MVDAPTLRKAPAPSRLDVASRPAPARAHRTSLPLAPRQTESPTSLSKLLGCSFAYAVEYLGRIRSRASPRIVADNRLFGSLAHEVLASVARSGGLTGGSGRELALDALERTLATYAALLLLPGFQHDLVQLRDAIGGAASLLARVIEADRLRVHAVETALTTSLGERVLGGTPDLVLEGPDGRLVLLDLKWSGASYRTDELRAGTALQLSAYAALLEAAGTPVRTLGYLVLRGRRLLVRGEPLAFAQRIHPELLARTWAATRDAWAERSSQLSAGDVFVEGIATLDHAPPEDAVLDTEGRLTLPPPCRFCALDLLCGRSDPRA